ncbi:MAG: HPr family phosphocarrier protein [Rhodospirillaceae bacterium]|nr:HPr family phosphocarrier protein [Rhodospirillaceae bacterium]
MSAERRATVEILNSKGLHARAAAKFCKTAHQFDAEVAVARNGTTVSGGSIMGLMMLAASQGTTIEISAAGPDAEAAMAALCALVANRFDEE